MRTVSCRLSARVLLKNLLLKLPGKLLGRSSGRDQSAGSLRHGKMCIRAFRRRSCTDRDCAGVDLEKDILGQMGFKPIIAKDLKTMDPKFFTDGPLGLKELWAKEE